MKTINKAEFRKELLKAMPGYSWTIHKSYDPENYLEAAGIQSSGFNRTSTMYVSVRVNHESKIEYAVTSSGYGTRAVCVESFFGTTLARAIRYLQDYYSKMARKYTNLLKDLEAGRIK